MAILEKCSVTEEEAQMVINFALTMAESLFEDDTDDFEELDRVLNLSSNALETVPDCSTVVFGLCRSGILSPKESLETCIDQLREGYMKVLNPDYFRLDDLSNEYLSLLRFVESDN